MAEPPFPTGSETMNDARRSEERLSAETAYVDEVDGAQWAGSRASAGRFAGGGRPTGSVLGLTAMAAIGFLCVAQGAVSLAPRAAPVRVAPPPVDAVDTAGAEAAVAEERPLAVGPDPEMTENGLLVEPWRWPSPLTVTERVVLRAAPGEAAAAGREVAWPGRALRVIGRVRVGDGGVWLQVRTDDGGVAYLDSADVLEVAEFREREREAAELARAAAEAEAAAASASAPGAPNATSAMSAPPSEGPTSPAPGELY